MSTTVKYNDHEFKNVPAGFIKMGLVLTFSPNEIHIWEQHILRLLVRDFYIFYSAVDKFEDGKFVEMHFFCRQKDEISITYRIGCYAQAMFSFYKPIQSIVEANHQVPANYPECICIQSTKVSKGNLDDEPIYKCADCGEPYRPANISKSICDNKKCVQNKN